MKIKPYHFFSTLLVLIMTSCNGQTKNNTNSKESESQSSTSYEGKSKNTGSNFKNGQDYVEFKRARIFDKIGFTEPVEAMSILIPEQWKSNSEIMWNEAGTVCAGNNLSIKSSSPDGKYSFELMPNAMWAFVTDPQLAQFTRQQQFPEYCSYGEPMNAMDYFKNVFVRNELGNPQILEVKDNVAGQRILEQKAEKNRAKRMRGGMTQFTDYSSCITATVKYPNGQEALVLCGVMINENVIANQYNGTYAKSYTTVATERMVFKYPAGEKDKASNMLTVIMSSIRTNTAWQRAVDDFWQGVSDQSRSASLGRINAMDAQTAQMGRDAIAKGQQNLNNMDANMRSWEAKQQSQDRMHTNFIKTIREVENYADATGKVEMVSGYNHAWSRSDGSSFIMSDNPNFDPSSVFQDQQWKEMRKVD